MSRPFTQEDITFLKERYATTGNVELAHMMGRSKESVRQKGRRLGLYKDHSFLDALQKEKLALINSPQSIRKRAETQRGIIKAERRRILFGLPQKAKRKVARMTRAKNGARTRMRKAGYIVTDDHNRIFYDFGTRRSPKMGRNAEKNGIRTLPLREDEAVNG